MLGTLDHYSASKLKVLQRFVHHVLCDYVHTALWHFVHHALCYCVHTALLRFVHHAL